MKQRRFYVQGGKPLSSVEIEQQMLRTLDLMELYTNGGTDYEDGEIVPSLAQLGRDAADKEARHKAAYNVATLRTTGSNREMRLARVEQDTGVKEKKREREYAEVAYDARKQFLGTLRYTLDALRTMAANVRSQI